MAGGGNGLVVVLMGETGGALKAWVTVDLETAGEDFAEARTLTVFFRRDSDTLVSVFLATFSAAKLILLGNAASKIRLAKILLRACFQN